MPQSEGEVIDFKPFFDMIVGILFILLIFIAAQLFFTRWDDPLAQTESRERSRRLAFQWQQQATDLLEDIAVRLRGVGLSAAVDVVDRAVTVPLGELLSVSDNGAVQFHARTESVGATLAERLSCIPGQDRPRPADCPPVDLLRLGGVRSEVRVAGVPPSISLPSDRYAHLLTTLLGAQLLRGAPALAAMNGSGGVPALQPGSIVTGAAQAGGAPQGDLALRFSFEPPPSR